MVMKSKDLLEQEKKALCTTLMSAMKSDNEEEMAKAFSTFAETIQAGIVDEAKGITNTADSRILSARGVRQLTTGEHKFYDCMIKAMESSDIKKALIDLEVAMPETIIESVFEDIRTAHPLLDAVTFVNTMGKIKMIVNKTGVQLAAWGKLGTAITKELEGSIAEIDTGLYKLTAFLPVSKDMLALGANWIDRYVREILSEAIAQTVENSIVDGDGNNSPIGMSRSVADDVTVTAGVYPKKTAVKITEITPATYGAVISKMAVAPNGKTRVVTEVIFIVNPVDYLLKILPATTSLLIDGTYKNDIFPFPTKVIQSTGIREGEAIVGIANRYFIGIGSPKQGNIEYSDEFQFLEDNRVYITKLYGNGMPLDDTAFQLLDISELQPMVNTVAVKGVVNTKATT